MRTMEINLPLGELIIGRGPECYLRVDEPMVSRLHAKLRVTPTTVFLEDLGSRNGSRINGVAASGTVSLNPGDILGVGTQQFTLEREEDPLPHRPTVNYAGWQPNSPNATLPLPSTAQTPQSSEDHGPVSLPTTAAGNSSFNSGNMTNPLVSPAVLAPEPSGGLDPPTHSLHPESEPSDPNQAAAPNRGSAYRLFWGLTDRVLQMGRVDEAERMMGPRLAEMRTRAEAGEALDDNLIIEALRRCLKLAAATKKDQWFGWLFDFARLAKFKMPVPLLDEIYSQVFVCRPAVGQKIIAYAQSIEDENIVVRLSALRRLCRE
jgi:hypothetical protein